MAPFLQSLVLGTSISFSFILAGNAITQSFMTVPALLVGIPPPSSPDYASKSAILGRQWRECWKSGTGFFRPISSLGVLGYAFSAYFSYSSHSGLGRAGGDWRLLAIATLMQFVIIVHAATVMQPLNEKIAALDSKKEEGWMGGGLGAEEMMRKWRRLNLLRMVTPVIAGGIGLFQLVV